jgi:SAM-dependent methyltransferase
MKLQHYSKDYFESGIFEADYLAIAEVITGQFKPKRILDVGCGPGHLSRKFAGFGLQVMAIDEFSSPDFEGLPIHFERVNLNEPAELLRVIGKQKFDAVICLEVAEHLRPEVSEMLIKALTESSDVVIFSAAVPNQGGHEHINLRPRDYWHAQFGKNGFLCGDRLRALLRVNPQVPPWYQLNVLDYVRKGSQFEPDSQEVIARLMASESNASSKYFDCRNQLEISSYYLNAFPVNVAFKARQLVGKLRKRTLKK